MHSGRILVLSNLQMLTSCTGNAHVSYSNNSRVFQTHTRQQQNNKANPEINKPTKHKNLRKFSFWYLALCVYMRMLISHSLGFPCTSRFSCNQTLSETVGHFLDSQFPLLNHSCTKPTAMLKHKTYGNSH